VRHGQRVLVAPPDADIDPDAPPPPALACRGGSQHPGAAGDRGVPPDRRAAVAAPGGAGDVDRDEPARLVGPAAKLVDEPGRRVVVHLVAPRVALTRCPRPVTAQPHHHQRVTVTTAGRVEHDDHRVQPGVQARPAERDREVEAGPLAG